MKYQDLEDLPTYPTAHISHREKNVHAVLQYYNIQQKTLLFLHIYNLVYKSKSGTCQITYCNYLSNTSPLRVLAGCNLETYHHYHYYHYYSWFCHIF